MWTSVFSVWVLLEGIGVLLVFDLLWIRGTVLAFLVPLWAPLGRTSILYIKAKGIRDHDALDPHSSFRDRGLIHALNFCFELFHFKLW